MNERTWLVELRKSKNLNQRQLAKAAGISPNYLCDIERGFRNPSGRVAFRIAQALNIDMAAFYSDEIRETQIYSA